MILKRILLLLLCTVYLCGCSSGQQEIDIAHKLRSDILSAEGCSFTAAITADYGDELYEFALQCAFDKTGALSFRVLKPDTISGITGKISRDEGALTFDDQVLAFKKLTDGQITPVTAPWLLIKAVREGYIAACGKDQNGYRLQLDDSYEEDLLTVDVWLNADGTITHGEFLWDGRRILSIDVKDFAYL